MAGFFILRLFYVLPNPLNRITAATDNTRRFGLSNLRYDKNGNITHLTRGGHLKEMPDWDKDDDFGTMDQLDYQYFDGSNRLRSVTDGILKNDTSGKGEFVDGNKDGDDYVYDPNGNMTQDLNKGIKGTTPTEKGIEYNHLNLPTKVSIDAGGANKGTISYIYDATGVKLRKNVLKQGETTPTATDYAGNYIYENNILQFFGQLEGYVEPKNPGNLSQGYDYIYQYKDHLGNVRLSYTDNNGTTEIVEENNYYPFGLEHKGYNNVINGTENNYQTYQGQELEEELGKNTLAFQWRDYDPAIARFNKIDRFAEKYYSHSPYHFTKNNPLAFREIKGDSINLAHLRDNNKEAYDKLINQLQDFTGYTLNIDDDGNLTVDKEKGVRKKNGKKTGSRFARKVLRKAIGHEDTVTVMDNPDGKSKVDLDENQNYTNILKLDSNEINSEKMLGGLNPLTNDIGMTFFHEIGHTPVGGGHHDPVGAGIDGNIYPGPNVGRANRIRRQLGSSFGQRRIYNDFRINMSSTDVKGDVFRAYSRQSLNLLRKAQTPTTLYSKIGN